MDLRSSQGCRDHLDSTNHFPLTAPEYDHGWAQQGSHSLRSSVGLSWFGCGLKTMTPDHTRVQAKILAAEFS